MVDRIAMKVFYLFILPVACTSLKQLSVTMPSVTTTTEDSYQCSSFKVPETKATYLVKFEALIKSKGPHHILLFGCSDDYKKEYEGKYYNCGSGMGSTCHGGSAPILFAWARNAPPKELPKDVGFRIGGDSSVKYLALQIHYKPIVAEADNSGLTLSYTLDSPKYLAGIFLLGSGFADIPGCSPNTQVTMGCRYDHNAKADLYPFAFRTHAHALGKDIEGYHYNGTWQLIGQGNPQWPQFFYPVHSSSSSSTSPSAATGAAGQTQNQPPPLVFKPGDYLFGRCSYDSSHRRRHTFMGSAHTDEMCNFYIMYYTEAASVDPAVGTYRDCWGWDGDKPDLVRLANHMPVQPHITNAKLDALATEMNSKDMERKEAEAKNECGNKIIPSKIKRITTDKIQMESKGGHKVQSLRGGDDGGGGSDRRILGSTSRSRSNGRQAWSEGHHHQRPDPATSQDFSQYGGGGGETNNDYYDERAGGGGYGRGVGRDRTRYQGGAGGSAAADYDNSRYYEQDYTDPGDQTQQKNHGGSRANDDLDRETRRTKPPPPPAAAASAGKDEPAGLAGKTAGDFIADFDMNIDVNQSWTQTVRKSIGFGQIGGVAVDKHNNVVVFHRANRVWDSATFTSDQRMTHAQVRRGPIKDSTILVISHSNGSLISSRGAQMFYLPHGISVDHDGNLWVTDVALHQVFKLSAHAPSNGGKEKPLITLGVRFSPGSDRRHFCKPADVAVTRPTHNKDSSVYVADGYCNGRIIEFTDTGRFVRSWGHLGEEGGVNRRMPPPNTFNVVHSLALIEEMKLICAADRQNGRVQCFHLQTGEFQFQITSDLFSGTLFAISYCHHHGHLFAVNGWKNSKGFVLDLKNSDHHVLATFQPKTGFHSPHDLEVTADSKHIYVVELDGAITRFDLNQIQDSKEHKSVKKAGVAYETKPSDEAGNSSQIVGSGPFARLRSLTSQTNAGLIVGALLIVPVIIILIMIITLKVIRLSRGRRGGGYGYKKRGMGRHFNLGDILSGRPGHKGFNRVSTDESDHEIEPLTETDDGEEEEVDSSSALNNSTTLNNATEYNPSAAGGHGLRAGHGTSGGSLGQFGGGGLGANKPHLSAPNGNPHLQHTLKA